MFEDKALRGSALRGWIEAAYRRKYEFDLVPVEEEGCVERHPTLSGRWISRKGRPLFSLESKAGKLPSGWVLLNSYLWHRQTPDLRAILHLEREGEAHAPLLLKIPVTRKGTIHEMIKLPPGITEIRWSPIGAAGSFEHAPITMTKVGLPERLYRMFWRVANLLRDMPKERQRALNLGIKSLFLDLPKAYQIAGEVRTFVPAMRYGRWVEKHSEAGVETLHIYADAVIDALEKTAGEILLRSNIGTPEEKSGLALVRKLFLPKLAAKYRQEFGATHIVMKMPAPLEQARGPGAVGSTSQPRTDEDE